MANLFESIHHKYSNSKDYFFGKRDEVQEPEFLLLTLHCQNELKETIPKIQKENFQVKYKLLYNTEYPYTIQTDMATRTISMYQKPIQ